jgi:hypothetical protein
LTLCVIIAKAQLVEVAVSSALSQQLSVCAGLNQAAAIKHDDAVSMLDG